jgi:linoleoyl-CoA desaturase
MEKLAKPQYTKSGNEWVFRQLRMEVSEMVEKSSGFTRSEMLLKAILFPFVYIATYLTALIWGKNIFVLYGCYFLLGVLLVIIFLNLIHDAVHGSIFKSNKLNDLYVHFFDLMGANSFIWKLRHVRFHHNYPNVNGWDTDLEQSDLARVFPSGDFSRFHRYQHIYLPFLYPLYLPNWLLLRDFKDFFNKKKTVRKLVEIPRVEYIKLIFFKAIFFAYIVIIPKLILGISWWTMAAAFCIMLFTASIFSLIVLLSPHANTESEFPLADKDEKLPHSWMMHMMKTTNDVTSDNWFTRFFMGCFNYHIVHHLFPHINHLHYPEITQLLKKYSAQYGLPYREYSLWTSLKNHYLLLKKNRIPENIFEDTM